MTKAEFDIERCLALAEAEGLDRKGRRIQCPARCSEDARSASVGEKDGTAVWHCHRCGEGGSAVDLVMRTRNLSAGEALRALGGSSQSHWATMTPPKPPPPIPDVVQVWQSSTTDDPAGRRYLEGRGLGAAADAGLVRFATGAAGDRWVDGKAAQGYRVAMPLFDAEGTLRSVQLRAVLPKHPRQLCLPGISTTALAFGNPARLAKARVVFCAEGMADTLALQLAGAEFAQGGPPVATIGAPGADQVRYLPRFLPASGAVVLLCEQADQRSREAFAGVADELRGKGHPVATLPLPAGVEDPADWLQKRGLEAVVAGLRQALSAATAARPEPEPAQDPAGDGKKGFLAELAKRVGQDPSAAFEAGTLERILAMQGDLQQWARVRQILRPTGMLRELDRVARQRARQEQSRQRAPEGDELQTVGDVLRSAPKAAHGLVIPRPYYLSEHETGKVSSQGMTLEGQPMPPVREAIARGPVIITIRYRDEETRTEALRLSWMRAGRWSERIVGREVAMNANKLLDLAGAGLPVGSHNAKEVSRYLADFEAANDADLSGPRISSRLGWQGRRVGDAGFLVGRTYYPKDGGDPVCLDLEELPPSWRDEWIAFRGSDHGDEQVANGLQAAGTYEEWLEAVTPVKDHPRAALALYAAFVPPMLEILGARNFIIDWAGQTSLGKTTCLRVAASVWGCPDELRDDAAIASWDGTRVATERRGALLSSLPLILDDTKRARHPKAIAEVLYGVANGRGRDRGSLKGLAATKAWRTVLLSSGEAPAVSYTEDGGTRARVIEITGMPFGGQDDEHRRIVDRVNVGIAGAYGHAGPRLIRFLLAKRQEDPEFWGNLAAAYRERAAALAEQAPNGVAARLAGYVAAVEIAGAVVHAALDLPWTFVSPFTELWEEIRLEAAEAPPEIRAMQALASWCQANEANFIARGMQSKDNRPPFGGWAGLWEAGDNWDTVSIYPTTLERVLRDLGFEPGAVLVAARDRGWLETDGGTSKRLTKLVRVGRHLTDAARQRFYVVRRQAFEDVGAIEA